MKFEKLLGVVLKEVNTNEADKVLTVLSESKGKIMVFAKGARRARNSFVLSTQLLCYSEFVLFKGKDMYYLSSADLIKHFYCIREDIIKLTYSAHILEICSDGVQENQYSGDVLKLLLNTLYIIENSINKSYELIISIFELKFVSIIGFTPDISECNYCKKVSFNKAYYNFSNNFIVCEDCYLNAKRQVPISFGTLEAMKYIIGSTIKNIFKVNLLDNLVIELRNFTSQYLNHVMEKEYKKLNMLKDFN